MDKSQHRVSFISLLIVVFRIYRKWKAENDDQILRRASEIALENGRHLLTKKEAAVLEKVVNGSEAFGDGEDSRCSMMRRLFK